MHLQELPKPTWERVFLFVLGKANANSDAGTRINEFSKSEELVTRYFAVIQERIAGNRYWLRIIWCNNMADLLASVDTSNKETLTSQPQSNGKQKPPLVNVGIPENNQSDSGLIVPDSNQEWPEIVLIDHNGAWQVAISSYTFLSVSTHSYDDIDNFSPMKPCVVLLHGNGIGGRSPARLWFEKLTSLIETGMVTRVIVASAGGHPSEKGIDALNGFVWAVAGDEAIHNTDLNTIGSAKRDSFLELLKR